MCHRFDILPVPAEACLFHSTLVVILANNRSHLTNYRQSTAVPSPTGGVLPTLSGQLIVRCQSATRSILSPSLSLNSKRIMSWNNNESNYVVTVTAHSPVPRERGKVDQPQNSPLCFFFGDRTSAALSFHSIRVYLQCKYLLIDINLEAVCEQHILLIAFYL